MDDLNNKTLLVISNGYPTFESYSCTFVKSLVDSIALNIKQIHVFVPVSIFKQSNLKIIKNNNVSIYFIPYLYIPNFSKNINLGFSAYLSCLYFIHKYKINFDFIHSFFIWKSGYIGAKLSQKFNVPHIITGEGFDVYDFPNRNRFSKFISRYSLNFSDYVLYLSNFLKCECLKLTSTKIKITPNGFDEHKFKIMSDKEKKYWKEKFGFEKNKKIIVCIANLVTIKNHHTILKSISLLSNLRQDFKVYFIGVGNLKEALIKDVIDLNLKSFVNFYGHCDFDLIPKVLACANLSILASFKEGGPTVLYESLACGIPFISSNVGAVSEVIVEGVNGFVFNNSLDYTELANLINKSLSHKWFALNIRKSVINYSWKNISKKVISIYKSIFYH